MQALFTFLTQLHPSLGDLKGVPLYVFLLVIALGGAFLVGYAFQGTRVAWQLWSVVRRIRKLSAGSRQVDPKDVAEVLIKEPFKHLWDEYADTLHPLRKASAGSITLTDV